jgi:hypothetical protein
MLSLKLKNFETKDRLYSEYCLPFLIVLPCIRCRPITIIDSDYRVLLRLVNY